MNQLTQPLPREHHFYVAIAKFLFHHLEHGIVSVQDPIKIMDAQRYGLSPIILYGVTVAGLPIRWMTFAPIDRPKAFRDVLHDAWRNAVGLRGRPDILRINRQLATASPELAKEMVKTGVQVEVADAREKSLPASLRSAQDFSWWLLKKQDGNDRSLTESIQSLCRCAQVDHDSRFRDGHRGVNRREIEDRIRQWLALPVQMPAPPATGGLDWEPGPWLSSWETSLPPNQPRYFKHDASGGNIWLLTGEKAPEDMVGEDDFWAENDCDKAAEIVKNLVACWPNPPAEIARCAGITLQELQWFISGKAPLDRHARFALEALLGIGYDEIMHRYVKTETFVLVAHKTQAIKAAYEFISNGGDARSYEIVPRQGAADPSWQYLLINPYGESPIFVMAPRGATITGRLPNLLMNYDGITPVTPEFYRDVVSTCGRACREPRANIREMKNFVKRHEAQWTDCDWQPE